MVFVRGTISKPPCFRLSLPLNKGKDGNKEVSGLYRNIYNKSVRGWGDIRE
jgi:hypothetical protein